MGALHGRVVLIAGAAHGIGLATARAAAAAGGPGIVMASLAGDAAATAAAEISASGTPPPLDLAVSRSTVAWPSTEATGASRTQDLPCRA